MDPQRPPDVRLLVRPMPGRMGRADLKLSPMVRRLRRFCQGVECGIRRKARVQDDRGPPGVQCGQGLDAQAADVEQRQHRQHPVLRRQGLHARGHPRMLALVGSLACGPRPRAEGAGRWCPRCRPAARARGIDVRVSVVAVALRQQMLERRPATSSVVEADDAAYRACACRSARHHGGERVLRRPAP